MVLDLLVGVLAAVAALISHLASSLDQLDPRLAAPTVLSGLLTVVAGLALAWRRIRPLTSYVVLVTATAIVSLTGHYTALLPLLMLLSLYSVAAFGSRQAGIAVMAVSIAAFVALALIGCPTCDCPTSWRARLWWWRPGQSVMPYGPVDSSRPSGCGRRSRTRGRRGRKRAARRRKSGCGLPGNCMTWWPTACP